MTGVVSILRLHQQLCHAANGGLVYRETIGIADVAKGVSTISAPQETAVPSLAEGYAFMDGRRAEVFPEVAGG